MTIMPTSANSGAPRVPSERALVVGTTADYIDLIESRFPGRSLFLTDARERASAHEAAPERSAEVLCDLTDAEGALAVLRDHLRDNRITLGGVTCFDCESLSLAARIAQSFALPYPSTEAVAACRSKLACKDHWRRAGLPCPDAGLVSSEDEALRFMERLGRPVVLKPLTGSGSELVFLCRDKEDCSRAFRTIEAQLAAHSDVRMYGGQAGGEDFRRLFAIEEVIEGEEYSCDYLIENGRVEIIRIARKLPAPNQPIGTILAYLLPADLPPQIGVERFRGQLREAARAVGLERAICMLDFFVRGDEAFMIEIAPRPGGDCLPFLLRQSCGLDILGAALDFAERSPLAIPAPERWRRLAGVRLFAPQPGVIRSLDVTAIREDPRVLETHLKCAPGHRVILPPENYDSRILGHVIFTPRNADDIESECLDIASKLHIEMETP
jgi:biotin carboxylase